MFSFSLYSAKLYFIWFSWNTHYNELNHEHRAKYICIIQVPSIKQSLYLKRFFTNFEYITFSLGLNERNIFHKRSISIKQLWLEIVRKIGCSQSQSDRVLLYLLNIKGVQKKWCSVYFANISTTKHWILKLFFSPENWDSYVNFEYKTISVWF